MKKLLQPIFSKKITILLTLALLAGFPVQAQQKALLRLSLEKGKTYYSEMKVDQSIDITSEQGAPVSVKQSMTFGYSMVVAEENTEEQVIRTSYEKIKFRAINAEYDSENAAVSTPALASVFRQLLGKSFTLKINKQGRITSVEGIDGIVSALLKESPADPGLQQLLKSTFTDQKFLDDFSKSFSIFADHPVKPGDSWTKTISSALFGSTENKLNYTLQKLTPSTAGIVISNEIKVALEVKQTKTQLSGTGNGTIEVDRKSGFPLASTLISRMSGTLVQDGHPSSMTITATFSITGKIK